MNSRYWIAGLFALSLVTALTVLPGCREEPVRRGLQRGGSLRQDRRDQAEALFQTVVGQLRNIPDYVDVEVSPPVVILDATKSRDRQDVMAICRPNPTTPDGPNNFLIVLTNNASFRSGSTRAMPGDVVKYYIDLDRESLEAGIEEQTAVELEVAQVIDDQTLIITPPLTIPILDPQRVELWRYPDDHLTLIQRRLTRYVRSRLPPLAWEPSPDEKTLDQIAERLNQWLQQSQPTVEWKRDPLWDTLPESLLTAERLQPYISNQALASERFERYDARLLQEAVLLGDVADWARGESFDPVEQAAALFDWTVRHVQLDADKGALPYRPWQLLMYGHGTAKQRAWLFAGLCRQLGLDIVILSLQSSAPAQEGSTPPKDFWAAALVHQGQLYLFDPRLGLPIPGPDGKPVATLAEVSADPTLLRRLDLEDEKYPVDTKQFQAVAAGIVADHFTTSRRAKLVGARLRGQERILLATNPTAIKQKLTAVPGISEVTLWDEPTQNLYDQLWLRKPGRTAAATEFEPFAWRPHLWKARLLHLQGRERTIVDEKFSGLEEKIDNHRDAMQLYSSPQVRPPERLIQALGSPERRNIYHAAKARASFWLGLLSYDEGRFETAVDYLLRRTLQDSPRSPWAAGARYNLARAFEALGRTDEAASLLERDTSPQQRGNRLRARWLKDSASKDADQESRET